MMLKFLVPFLLIIGGISANCVITCDDDDVPDDFPETEEQLKEFCRPGLAYLECEYSSLEKCENAAPEGIRIISRLISTLTDICTEGTPLHTGVVDNLKCFHGAVNSMGLFHTCPMRQESAERTQRLAESLLEEGLVALSDIENVTSKTHECIQVMNFLACNVLHVEKVCGTGGMDVSLELLQRVRPVIVRGCDESYQLLPAVLSFRRAEEEAAHNIAEAFQEEEEVNGF